jgi:hypothetical protein
MPCPEVKAAQKTIDEHLKVHEHHSRVWWDKVLGMLAAIGAMVVGAWLLFKTGLKGG